MLLPSGNMRFENFLFLSMASIVRIADTRAASVEYVASSSNAPNTVRDDFPKTDVSVFEKRDSNNQESPVEKKPAAEWNFRGMSEVLACIMKRWKRNGDESGECLNVSFWNILEDLRDNEIEERKKTKKNQWDIQTLILGAGVKLILFLPILAVLTGKAISLSLTSLLITSLGFLYKTQVDSFAKRKDFNERSTIDDYYM